MAEDANTPEAPSEYEASQRKDSPREQQASKPPQVRLADDYESLYANNVRFESSVWDLKLLFGQLDQSSGSEDIEIHTGVSIPWTAAKIMAHYLRVNIMAHELENGKIKVNPRVYPGEIPPLGSEFENNELAKKIHENAVRIRDEFIKDQQP